MAAIEGLSKLLNRLSKMHAEGIKALHTSVIVGYTAKYALPLHERVAMKWRGLPRDRSVRLHKSGKFVVYGYKTPKKHPPGLFWGPTGQAKFLEEPARTLQTEIARTIREV